jgi:hypothetical protein
MRTCGPSTPVLTSTRRLPASRCRRWRRQRLLCRQLGLLANVEIKPAAGFEALTGEVVARQVRALGGEDLPLVSSFSEEALAARARPCPNCRSVAL